MESFYRLACSLRFTPEFALIFKSGNGSEHWDEKALTAQQKMKTIQLIKHLNQSNEVEAFLPVWSMTCPYTDPSESVFLYIKTDGSIQPCQSLYNSGCTLGNVFELNWDSFSSKVNEITMLALQKLQTDYDCGKCLLQAGCQKGCMAAAVNLHGDPLSNDGECDYRMMIFLDRTLSTMKKERTSHE